MLIVLGSCNGLFIFYSHFKSKSNVVYPNPIATDLVLAILTKTCLMAWQQVFVLSAQSLNHSPLIRLAF